MATADVDPLSLKAHLIVYLDDILVAAATARLAVREALAILGMRSSPHHLHHCALRTAGHRLCGRCAQAAHGLTGLRESRALPLLGSSDGRCGLPCLMDSSKLLHGESLISLRSYLVGYMTIA